MRLYFFSSPCIPLHSSLPTCKQDKSDTNQKMPPASSPDHEYWKNHICSPDADLPQHHPRRAASLLAVFRLFPPEQNSQKILYRLQQKIEENEHGVKRYIVLNNATIISSMKAFCLQKKKKNNKHFKI